MENNFRRKKYHDLCPKETMREVDLLLQKINQRISESLLAGGRKKLGMAPQPSNLVGGVLKDYQRESLAWMCELASHGLNGILADDMGLGKTIQTISYLCYLSEQKKIKGKHLIIVPKNVLRNWLKQINSWSKDHVAVILPGTEPQRSQIMKDVIKKNKFDVLICTYYSVQAQETALSKIFWETLILDEAHSIKNDETYLAQCLRRIRAKFKLLLTGTPLSNQLHQLWSLLNFILPNLFKDSSFFDRIQDCANDENREEEERKKFQVEIAQKFQKLLNPFLLRRSKSEINLGLKQKKQITLFVSLSDLQLKMYKNYLKCKSVYGNIDYIQQGRAIQLRKICNHPYMFPEIQDPKLPPYGQHLIESCGKMKLLDKLLKKLLKEGHKILIFSQFVQVLKIIEDYMTYRNYEYCYISGESSLDVRENQLNQFNTSKKKNIFLISTRAGGIGLNLVAADIVIIYDIDWNPQMDRQAMDRAYRIGQKNSVKVFKFITMSTIQERMLQIQKYKLLWDELVIQKGGIVRLNNSGEDKFNKIDYDKLGEVGVQQIFRIQNKFDDQTIEQIIKFGQEKDQEKTKQIREKLEKQFQNLYNNTASQLLLNQTDTNAKFNYVSQEVGFVNVQAKKSKILQSKSFKKYIKPQAYQLFSDERKAGELLFQLREIQEQDQKSKKQIIKELNSLGFYNWSKQEYRCFVQANMTIPKWQYKLIKEQIPNKTLSEVKKYSECFYERAKELKGVLRETRGILNKQEQFKINQEIEEMTQKIKKMPKQLLVKQPKFSKATINKNSICFLIINSIIEKGVTFEQLKPLLDAWFPKVIAKTQTNTKAKLHKFLSTFLEDLQKEQILKNGPRQLQEQYEEIRKKLQKLKIKDKSLQKSAQKPANKKTVQQEEGSNRSAETQIKK